jgi:TetR/AcrR family transcriptional repressor of nem operon
VPRPSRKQDFLDSARRLVQAQGFAAMSGDAVCKDTGTTKGAFFHYFRDKDELGIELLRYFRESGRAALRASRHAEERDARRRLRRYLAHLETIYASDPRFRDGCLYAILAYENADPRSEGTCSAAESYGTDSSQRRILDETEAAVGS